MTTSIVVPIVSVFVLRGTAGAREVLLMRRTAPPVGAWCQVAGKIEAAEAASAAARRALSEEAGLEPQSFWSADSYEQFYEPEHDRMTVGPCFVACVSDSATPVLKAEHDAFAWLDFKAAIARVSFPGQRRVLREIAETFNAGHPHPMLRIAL